MLEIIPNKLHWLKDIPSENDLCVHGGITLTFNKEVLIDASGDDLTLSTAVIFLLRSIEKDHTGGNKISEKIIPKCGHMVFLSESGDDAEISHCPFGIDWWVEHSSGNTTLIFEDGSEITTTLEDYIQAILKFADSIKAFYEDSEPKKYYNVDEQQAFEFFLAEWERRSEAASKYL